MINICFCSIIIGLSRLSLVVVMRIELWGVFSLSDFSRCQNSIKSHFNLPG